MPLNDGTADFEWTFELIDEPDGFLVQSSEGSVRVMLHPAHWEVAGHEHSIDLPLVPHDLVVPNLVHRLLDRPADPPTGRREVGEQERRRMTEAMRPAADRELRRLLRRVDPIMLAMQRATWPSLVDEFAEGANAEYLAERLPDPKLLRGKAVARDILTQRAAAIAAGNLRNLVEAWLGRLSPRRSDAPSDSTGDPLTPGSSTGHPFRAAAAWQALLRHRTHDDPPPWDALVEALPYWRDFFSPSGTSYPALERTLASVPDGFHDELVCALRHIELKRPVTDALGLRVLTTFANHGGSFFAERLGLGSEEQVARLARHGDAFVDARRDDIERAMRRVGAHLGVEMDSDLDGHVQYFVRFLTRYPARHIGTLEGLADKAIAWDRQEDERKREEALAELGATTAVTLPPIAPPEVAGVRLLATVGEIVEEGASTQSAVASSAWDAVRGRCYVFRVERDGEATTVVVNRDGEVSVPPSPRTRNNGAVGWGEQVLREWGRSLSEHRRGSSGSN